MTVRQDASAQSRSQPLVRIAGVSKQFGEFVAVDDVSLDIQRGEIFCLLGGSGCGKTTLLRMLAGFERPTAGEISIDGVDMANVPPYERPVNMMFQSYALFPHMTVEQNVAFGLKQEGLPRDEIAERVADMLAMVKLDGLQKRKPHQLSGGQKQRVALARSLVKRPKLLLLDEPLGALDKKLREHTQFELLNLQAQLGVTFVVVTHDQEEAMTLATRIGVMNHGKIAQIGAPHEVYEFPNSRFVAEFIGSVNMFEGRLLEDDPDFVRIACQELDRTVLVDRYIRIRAHESICVAVRPEKIDIALDRPLAQENVASGVVQEIAYLGEISVYRVRLESGKIVRVTRPNMRRREAGIAAGQVVYLHWHPSSAIVIVG